MLCLKGDSRRSFIEENNSEVLYTHVAFLLGLRDMVSEKLSFIQPGSKDKMLIKMKCRLTEHLSALSSF